MRWGLMTASVVLPVAVAVASNQILNDGVWDWWWGAAAVALTAISATVTHRLSGYATGSVDDQSPTGEEATDELGRASEVGSQIVERSTVGADVTQVQHVQGAVRIVRRSSATPPTAVSHAISSVESSAQEVPEQETAMRLSADGHVVSDSQVGASIDQISNVRGDVDIESS